MDGAVSDSANGGLNLMLMCHHAKITIEYQSQLPNCNREIPPRNNALVIQACSINNLNEPALTAVGPLVAH